MNALPRTAAVMALLGEGSDEVALAAEVADLILTLARHHIEQWRLEDVARLATASAEEVMVAKRGIDKLNAARIDTIEQLDVWECARSRDASMIPHTETFGQVMDRLVIAWVRAQMLTASRPSGDTKLATARAQLRELGSAYDAVVDDIESGRRRFPRWLPLKQYGRAGDGAAEVLATEGSRPSAGVHSAQREVDEATRLGSLDVLLDLCRGHVLGGPIPPLDAVNWATFEECVRGTESQPLLGWLARTGRLPVPPWISAEMVTYYEIIKRRNAARRSLALQISEALDDRGVTCAWRKGVQMAGHYPDRGCRPFNDLDLYVAPQDVDTTRDVLAAGGFVEQPMTRIERNYMLLATTTVPAWERRRPHRKTDRVDISRQFVLPAMATPRTESIVEDMLGRRRVEPDGLPVLSPPDLMLDLAMNQFVGCTTLHYVGLRRFQRLRGYLDVLLAARALDATDWQNFDALVAALELDRVVETVFTMCAELFEGARELAPLERWCRPGAADLIGHYELPTPYRWRHTVRERLVMAELPPDLPASQCPLT